MNHKDKLIEVCNAYKTVRIAQHAYFATVRNNKKPGAIYVDASPKLTASKQAEATADKLVKQVLAELEESDKLENQPELFGRR